MGRLSPRASSDLINAGDFIERPGTLQLVPDTMVYIELAAGRLPQTVIDLYARSVAFHCAVCVGEIAIGLANKDPAHPTTPRARAYFTALFAAIPATRILAPDASVWADAGLVTGILARPQGFRRDERKETLNDALIYLTAARAGLPVLTRNRDDFDLIQQLAPGGMFIHY